VPLPKLSLSTCAIQLDEPTTSGLIRCAFIIGTNRVVAMIDSGATSCLIHTETAKIFPNQ
jgi:hypothetical protein